MSELHVVWVDGAGLFECDDDVRGSSDAIKHDLLIVPATSTTPASPCIIREEMYSLTALWSVAVVGV